MAVTRPEMEMKSKMPLICKDLGSFRIDFYKLIFSLLVIFFLTKSGPKGEFPYFYVPALYFLLRNLRYLKICADLRCKLFKIFA